MSSNASNAKVTYLQVLPISVSNGTRSVKVNALLDSGSDWSLITKVLADKLKLTGEDQPLTLSNAVCTSTRRMSKLVNFQISSPSHPSKILISNAWVVENLDLPRFKINSTINKQWNHLQDIQIEVDNSQEIINFDRCRLPTLAYKPKCANRQRRSTYSYINPLWMGFIERKRKNKLRQNKFHG